MENKTGAYVKYAIGEIILVVIGILIALQINNWNDSVKERAEEHRLLEKISLDIKTDINQFETLIREAKKRQLLIDSLNKILFTVQDSDPSQFYVLNFNAISVEGHFEVNSATFDESQSTGTLKFIQTDSIREQIFTYYRIAKRNYDDENTVQSLYRDIIPTLIKKIFTTKEYVRKSQGYESKLPNLDIAALSRDQEYVALLFHKKISELVQIDTWKKFMQKATLLSQNIQAELIEND